jgi:hypothetical protein
MHKTIMKSIKTKVSDSKHARLLRKGIISQSHFEDENCFRNDYLAHDGIITKPESNKKLNCHRV